MDRDWHGIESGARIAKMTDLTEGFPQFFSIGRFKVEFLYPGQVPQCGLCVSYGHRVATCINDVKCFRCGNDGHIQQNCYKCFLCGHIRSECPDNPANCRVDEIIDDPVIPPLHEYAVNQVDTQVGGTELVSNLFFLMILLFYLCMMMLRTKSTRSSVVPNLVSNLF